MAEITAGSVKELRERTGAGMMDCKKALAETNGEMEAAIDWLRAKGLSAAAKKAGRTAAEGLVGVALEGHRGALVEVNSETDFVAKNELFQQFVGNVARMALEHGTDVESLGAAILGIPHIEAGAAAREAKLAESFPAESTYRWYSTPPSSVSTWLRSSTASLRPSGTVMSMRAPALRRITIWRRMCSSSCAMRAGG